MVKRTTRKSSGPTIAEAQRKRPRLSVSLDAQVLETLRARCAGERLELSAAVEAALRAWLADTH